MCKHITPEWLSTYIQPCVNTLHQEISTLTFDHVQKHHIGRAQHLYLTMFENTTSKRLSTYIWPCSKAPHRKGSALTSNHAQKHHIERALIPRLRIPGNWPDASILPENGISPYIWSSVTHPSITSEFPCTHIWSCKTTSHSHIKMAFSPRLKFPGNWLGASILPENGISPYIWSSGNISLNHIRMSMHSHLIM